MSWREHTTTVNEFHDWHKIEYVLKATYEWKNYFPFRCINFVSACNTTFTRIETNTISTVWESCDTCCIRDVLVIFMVALWEAVAVNTWIVRSWGSFFQFGNVREILVLMHCKAICLANVSTNINCESSSLWQNGSLSQCNWHVLWLFFGSSFLPVYFAWVWYGWHTVDLIQAVSDVCISKCHQCDSG